MIPKQNKYYVDPKQYLDADAVARQAQAMFPKIRFGVGPASLNANFDGDDSVIDAQLSKVRVGAETPTQSRNFEVKRVVLAESTPTREHSTLSTPSEAIHYKEGDAVFVLSLGIEGKIKNVLPHGIVNVELADGVMETMLTKNLEPVQREATSLPPMVEAPRPANDALLMASAAAAPSSDEASAQSTNVASPQGPAASGPVTPGGEP